MDPTINPRVPPITPFTPSNISFVFPKYTFFITSTTYTLSFTFIDIITPVTSIIIIIPANTVCPNSFSTTVFIAPTNIAPTNNPIAPLTKYSINLNIFLSLSIISLSSLSTKNFPIINPIIYPIINPIIDPLINPPIASSPFSNATSTPITVPPIIVPINNPFILRKNDFILFIYYSNPKFLKAISDIILIRIFLISSNISCIAIS